MPDNPQSKRRLAIDLTGLTGLAFLAGGVLWNFGPGWALTVAGALALAASIHAARHRQYSPRPVDDPE